MAFRLSGGGSPLTSWRHAGTEAAAWPGRLTALAELCPVAAASRRTPRIARYLSGCRSPADSSRCRLCHRKQAHCERPGADPVGAWLRQAAVAHSAPDSSFRAASGGIPRSAVPRASGPTGPQPVGRTARDIAAACRHGSQNMARQIHRVCFISAGCAARAAHSENGGASKWTVSSFSVPSLSTLRPLATAQRPRAANVHFSECGGLPPQLSGHRHKPGTCTAPCETPRPRHCERPEPLAEPPRQSRCFQPVGMRNNRPARLRRRLAPPRNDDHESR
jgi:hypothetical protein